VIVLEEDILEEDDALAELLDEGLTVLAGLTDIDNVEFAVADGSISCTLTVNTIPDITTEPSVVNKIRI
jgi:hypothetical protein